MKSTTALVIGYLLGAGGMWVSKSLPGHWVYLAYVGILLYFAVYFYLHEQEVLKRLGR